MKKTILLSLGVLTCLNLVACGSNSKRESAKAHSEKVEKAHKRKLAKKRREQRKRASESKKKAQQASQVSQPTQPSSQNNQQTTQSSNANNQSVNSNGEQVYTAHPSQGGTIYQTNGNAGSFQGDPNTITRTQQIQESIAREQGWE